MAKRRAFFDFRLRATTGGIHYGCHRFQTTAPTKPKVYPINAVMAISVTDADREMTSARYSQLFSATRSAQRNAIGAQHDSEDAATISISNSGEK
jgi:hypothetical protein